MTNFGGDYLTDDGTCYGEARGSGDIAGNIAMIVIGTCLGVLIILLIIAALVRRRR